MAEENSKKIVLILITALVLVMLGSGFFIYKMVIANVAEKEPAEVLGPRVIIEETTVNFNGRTNQYLQAQFAFEAADEDVAQELEEKKDVLIHIVNLVLMEQSQEVLDPEGKTKLITVLKKNINAFLTKGEIKNIYIQKFIVT
ncbi:MAG: flagellar basal body-associated FliL family protein [Peptococcia bacterium]|jgi:flagellar basal body-associated protein FliL